MILDVNVLDNRFYDVIIAEMSPFFEENGFKADGESFKNAAKSLKIEYDEQKQVYNLLCADLDNGTESEFSVLSSYLFDETQNKNDAVSVAIDFVDTARKALNIKAKRKAVSAELPVASQNGAVTVNTLTTKLLANYPALKETYKAEVSAKGKYLYLDFCTKFVVPEVRATLDSKNKKAIKKLVDMFVGIFTSGDREATNLTVAILAAAIGKDGDRFAAATAHMDECQPLVSAVNQQISALVKNKKFAKAMRFED